MFYILAVESPASRQHVSGAGDGWSMVNVPGPRQYPIMLVATNRSTSQSRRARTALVPRLFAEQRLSSSAQGRAANLPLPRRLVPGSDDVGAFRLLHKAQPHTGSAPIRSGAGWRSSCPSMCWLEPSPSSTRRPGTGPCTRLHQQHEFCKRRQSTRHTQAPGSLPSAHFGSSDRQMHSIPLEHSPVRYLRAAKRGR